MPESTTSAKVSIVLRGVEQFKRAVALANPETRTRTAAAIRKNTKAVLTSAQHKVPKRTGELLSTGRDEYSKDGLVGYVKFGFGKLVRRSRALTPKGQARAKRRPKSQGKGVYAPVVERGDKRRGHPAHPYLVPSLDAQKPTLGRDLDQAMKKVTQTIAANAQAPGGTP